MKHRTGKRGDRRASRRFPILAEMSYAVAGEPIASHGKNALALNISSTGILFDAGEYPDSYRPGERIEVRMVWPARLQDSVHLTLWMAGTVVRCAGPLIAVRIQRYEFRTARSAASVLLTAVSPEI